MMLRLFVLLMLAVFAVNASPARAQLPGQTAPSADAFRFAPPPSGGSSETCMKGFMSLREAAEKRGKLIKAASDRHAEPNETCKLIGAYSQAEIKMIKYVETNAQQCGIPPQLAERLNAGHKNTEALEKKVCSAAQQNGGSPAQFNDFGDPALQNGGRLER